MAGRFASLLRNHDSSGCAETVVRGVLLVVREVYMVAATKTRIQSLVEQAYSDGHRCHGDLELQVEQFSAHVSSVIERNVMSADPQAALDFLEGLHKEDLYLARACVEGSNAAWGRFNSIYKKYLTDLAVFVSPNRDSALELADSLPGYIYGPDRSGSSRLASYDGRSSLATWLRAVVSHRAYNERELKWNRHEAIESVGQITDNAAWAGIEGSLRTSRYQQRIKDALTCACKSLSDRERLLLLLRYDRELQLGRIARLLRVHPSTITRQLERIYEKLRENVRETLASKHNLRRQAIDECVAEILENPNQRILPFIKQP
jgi:RNA polymerase sigma-70 factor